MEPDGSCVGLATCEWGSLGSINSDYVEPIGYIPPVEADERHYLQLALLAA